MGTDADQQTDAQWPDGLDVPPTAKLQLSGGDGNVFYIIGRAQRAARRAGWTNAQLDAFQSIVMAGDYDHALRACMMYFDVS